MLSVIVCQLSVNKNLCGLCVFVVKICVSVAKMGLWGEGLLGVGFWRAGFVRESLEMHFFSIFFKSNVSIYAGLRWAYLYFITSTL